MHQVQGVGANYAGQLTVDSSVVTVVGLYICLLPNSSFSLSLF